MLALWRVFPGQENLNDDHRVRQLIQSNISIPRLFLNQDAILLMHAINGTIEGIKRGIDTIVKGAN
jgi:hypothetical protein